MPAGSPIGSRRGRGRLFGALSVVFAMALTAQGMLCPVGGGPPPAEPHGAAALLGSVTWCGGGPQAALPVAEHEGGEPAPPVMGHECCCVAAGRLYAGPGAAVPNPYLAFLTPLRDDASRPGPACGHAQAPRAPPALLG